jgi:hypothetical protein
MTQLRCGNILDIPQGIPMSELSNLLASFQNAATKRKKPKYPLELFMRVITVSLETMKLVKELPGLKLG